MVLKKGILFRCDGTDQIGLGHVSRCLNVANKFLNSAEWNTYFLGDYNAIASKIIADAGHDVIQIGGFNSENVDECALILKTIVMLGVDVLFLDSRSEMERADFNQLGSLNICTTTLDDPSDRRKFVDIAFYPPVKSVQIMNWDCFKGVKFVGWDYYPLNEEIIKFRRLRFSNTAPKTLKICVSMGSIDPLNYTSKILKELLYIDELMKIDVIIGPNNNSNKEIYKISSNANKSITIIENCEDIIEHFANADVGFVTFGVSAYEAACLGLPTMLFPISLDHFSSAQSFVDAGMAVHAWPEFPSDGESLKTNIRRFLSDKFHLADMSDKSLSSIDGLGSTRICDAILDFCEEQV